MPSFDPKDLAVKDLHQFIVGSIAPRPIAFASTVNAEGQANIAPYSFFNAFSSNPPTLVFSSNRRVQGNTTKDTLHNIDETGEVVINVVNYPIVRQMALASISYPPEIDEFKKAGLTPIASDLVKPYRLKESPVQFECKVRQIITLGNQGGAGHLIICDVLRMHIADDIIDERNRIDPDKLDLVGRLGRAYYVRASGSALFTLHQDQLKMALGFDRLPTSIRESKWLSGNELAQIAGLCELPSEWEQEALLKKEPELAQITLEELHLRAKALLAEERADEAFTLLMLGETK